MSEEATYETNRAALVAANGEVGLACRDEYTAARAGPASRARFAIWVADETERRRIGDTKCRN